MLKQKINKYDLIIYISLALLLIIGLYSVYSSSSIWANYFYNDKFYYLKRQIIFILIGLLLLLFFKMININKLKKYSLVFLIIGFISLILVLIPHIGSQINGSRSWFKIASFLIQPAEIFKLIIVFYLACKLDKYYDKTNSFFKTIVILLIPSIFGFALIMLQPDFGTGVIIVISIIVLLFVSGVNMSFFIKLGFIGLLGVVALIIAAPYRMKRIVSFLNPWSDPLGSGFQIIQSLYAIGPGGLLGLGFGNSIQKHFYLPEPQTDFIFAIISEEFGFLGILIVASLFLLIIYRGFHISIHCENKFGKYLSFGITFQLAFQALLNLMVVVGLIPVTGVTLPFLSYGGSSLLITMISMGILLNISKYNYE